MNLKNPYKLLFNVGVQTNPSLNNHNKLTKMINIFIIFWYHAFLMMSCLTILFREDYGGSLVLNACGFLFLVFCQVLNKYQKATLASIGILAYTMFHYFMITMYVAPERFVEFFYLIVPCGSLMFFRKEIYSWITLILATILFHIPFYSFGAYQREGILFLPPIMIFLFVINYMIVLYFKKLNTKNEQLLDEEKKKVEADKELIEKQHNSLEELSRFKNKFFINLSHEIRTPLTLISGNINQIESGNNQQETLDSLKHNLASITKLVDDVMDLAKIEEQGLTLQLVPVPVNLYLTKQFNMFKDIFKQKNISFSLDLAPEESYIAIDKLYFERAINNIINNAFKYTHENGNITLGAVLNKGKIEIKIKDDGIGIPEEMIDNIFNRFEQVDNAINKTGGSGIGLSFAQQVIRAHGATISVKSEENVETIFTISIDAVENKNVEQEEIMLFDVPKDTTPKVIFIVDDNEQIREYLKKIFANDNCFLFPDGPSALEAIPMHKPSCIISDYMMPNMNGYELIQAIRERGFSIPTVMLTANTDEKIKLEVLRLGIDDYLTKPFNEEELRLKVRHLIHNNNERIQYAKTEEEPVEKTVDNEFLNKLNTIIIENIQNSKFNADHLAQEMCVSSSTLGRKIKLLTGLSTKQYSLSLKMQEARKYIEENPLSSLKEIAYSVGISNQSRFSKQYEEFFGKKPLQ